MNTVLCGAGLPDSGTRSSRRSAANHPDAPQRRFVTLPLSSLGLPSSTGRVWTSSLARRLVVASGRIAFVILRTGSSPPVAPDPVSRRRPFSWLQAGERMPGEDFHLPGQVPFRAHEPPTQQLFARTGRDVASSYEFGRTCGRGGRARRGADRAAPAGQQSRHAPRLASTPAELDAKSWRVGGRV